MLELLTRLRVRLIAGRGWCRVCRERPRAELPGDDRRYCSEVCRTTDAEEQAFGM